MVCDVQLDFWFFLFVTVLLQISSGIIAVSVSLVVKAQH